MDTFQRVFHWLVLTYGAALVFYLFNLSTPPGNMPIFIVMAIAAVAALIFSGNKRRVGIAVLMLIVSLALIVKESRDGVELKNRLNKAGQQGQQFEHR